MLKSVSKPAGVKQQHEFASNPRQSEYILPRTLPFGNAVHSLDAVADADRHLVLRDLAVNYSPSLFYDLEPTNVPQNLISLDHGAGRSLGKRLGRGANELALTVHMVRH
jgi:hypothetical protein